MTDNKLIAEFMEVDFSLPYCYGPGRFTDFTEEHLAYDTDWGWLMPVVEKVNSIVIKNQAVRVTMRANGAWIEKVTRDGWRMGVLSTAKPTMLENTYAVVAGFIKWYNKQQYDSKSNVNLKNSK